MNCLTATKKNFAVDSGFSSIRSLTKGKIQRQYRWLYLPSNMSSVELKCIYYNNCTCQPQHEIIKHRHAYLILQDRYHKNYKLELKCPKSNTETVFINFTQVNLRCYSYVLQSKKGVKMGDIVDYIEALYQETYYNLLVNDCHNFCYKILQVFCKERPRHELIWNQKIAYLYFCLEDIQSIQGTRKHGFVVAQTNHGFWKFEIGGYGDHAQLNIQMIEGEISTLFQASGIIDVRLIDVIEHSESVWGNQSYRVTTDGSFNYCKFIMQSFTGDSENIVLIEENKTMIDETTQYSLPTLQTSVVQTENQLEADNVDETEKAMGIIEIGKVVLSMLKKYLQNTFRK